LRLNTIFLFISQFINWLLVLKLMVSDTKCCKQLFHISAKKNLKKLKELIEFSLFIQFLTFLRMLFNDTVNCYGFVILVIEESKSIVYFCNNSDI
jgi:hypothetical protein